MGQTNDRPDKKGRKTAQRFNDVKFVQYELSKEEREQCKTWQVSLADLETTFLRMCEAGYSLSVKWDAYSSSFAAFVQTRDAENLNFGLMLTGRGSSPLKAMKQACFKHYMIFDESWAAYAESRAAYEIDD